MKIESWYYKDQLQNLIMGNAHSVVADNQSRHNSIDEATLGLVFARHDRHMFAQAVKVLRPSKKSPQDIWGGDWKNIYDVNLLSHIQSVDHIMSPSDFSGMGSPITDVLKEACFLYLL